MAWTLKIKETKKGPKYQIWTTISDGYITDKWMTRDEILNFLFWYRFRDFMEKFVEDHYKFPSGWTKEDDGHRIHEKEKNNQFHEFIKTTFDDGKNMYAKFFEILISMGIKLDIQDAQYCVRTPTQEEQDTITNLANGEQISRSSAINQINEQE